MSRLFEALTALTVESRLARVAAQAIPAAIPDVISGMIGGKLRTSRPRRAFPTAEAQFAAGRQAQASRAETSPEAAAEHTGNVAVPGLGIYASPESRLVAWTEPNSLGAEKFRALAARLDHLRGQRPLRSLQVTSSTIHEGKTLISGNLAITLARYSNARTLLVEGDLHRPALSSALGLPRLRGIADWWTSPGAALEPFVRRLNAMPLWFLSAGTLGAQPADLLRSARFEEAFAQLAGEFEWVIVDSTPMLPIVDVNLWSRFVDGALLVVREGVTRVKLLQAGLRSLDNPQWVGVVVNDADEFDHADYQGRYYGGGLVEKHSARES
ncbi:MAG TPA: CpsD/CapB family tyrosine-protein kinase [Candidatus Acidoferrales bacterium]|nr:CpsD/CapB family tyrosine-protein kinase [Candidatus Acidoferrales bacterium]